MLYDIGKIGGRSYLVAFYEVQLLTESLEEASYATVPGIHANFYMWLFFAFFLTETETSVNKTSLLRIENRGIRLSDCSMPYFLQSL